MPRLIAVTNRCHSLHPDGHNALFDEIISNVFKKHLGLWFGWNGEIAQGKRTRAVSYDIFSGSERHTWDMSPIKYDNYYQGYVHKVMWAVFHNRPDLISYQRECFLNNKNYTL